MSAKCLVSFEYNGITRDARLLSYVLELILFSSSSWIWFVCPMPFAVFIFVYAEVRKLIARRYPHGFVATKAVF